MGQEESLPVDDSVPPHTLSERTLPAVAEYIKSGKVSQIVVLTGAGISTAAGIPDFRSPNTGLYHNLARLNLPYAEAVFDISYFRQNPEPFYVLAKELYPGKFFPTVSHAFIALLAQKDLLLRLFTQNIDCLERRAGVPGDKIVEAHGSFATQRCIECKKEYPDEDMKEHVFKGEVPHCKEKDCDGLVKPDIVFFGEPLPKAFEEGAYQTAQANLVLILGTSLTVFPFASLPDMARDGKPRLLFNMERVGKIGTRSDDVMELGPCDDGIRKLADLLGWRDELEELWRDVVGEKEAERQLQGRVEQQEEVEDEVRKLTREVATILKLDEDEVKIEVEEGLVANKTKTMEEMLGPKLEAKQRAEAESDQESRSPQAEPSTQGEVSEPAAKAGAEEKQPKAQKEEPTPVQEASQGTTKSEEEPEKTIA